MVTSPPVYRPDRDLVRNPRASAASTYGGTHSRKPLVPGHHAAVREEAPRPICLLSVHPERRELQILDRADDVHKRGFLGGDRGAERVDELARPPDALHVAAEGGAKLADVGHAGVG